VSVHHECSVDGCGRQAKRRGWCIAHYARWQKNGDPGPAEVRRRAQQHPADCTFDGCDAPYLAGGLCQLHYDGMRRGRANFDTDARSRRGSEHPNWHGGSVGYSGIHMRLRERRGNAVDRTCAHCGGRAAQWAYDHMDPNPELDQRTGLIFSLNLNRYMPLCASCHKVFDLSHGQRE